MQPKYQESKRFDNLKTQIQTWSAQLRKHKSKVEIVRELSSVEQTLAQLNKTKTNTNANLKSDVDQNKSKCERTQIHKWEVERGRVGGLDTVQLYSSERHRWSCYCHLFNQTSLSKHQVQNRREKDGNAITSHGKYVIVKTKWLYERTYQPCNQSDLAQCLISENNIFPIML